MKEYRPLVLNRYSKLIIAEGYFMKPRLKQLRKEKGLYQKFVAEKIGVSFQSLSEWENGHVEPRYSDARKLAELYECSMEDLYEKD